MSDFIKLKEYTKEEIHEQIINGEIDHDFICEYISQRDRVYNKLIDRVNELESIVEKIREKCKEPRKEMDFTVWVKLREEIITLEKFAEDINYHVHSNITVAYKCDIKNSINVLCDSVKHKLVYKEDIKDILNQK